MQNAMMKSEFLLKCGFSQIGSHTMYLYSIKISVIFCGQHYVRHGSEVLSPLLKRDLYNIRYHSKVTSLALKACSLMCHSHPLFKMLSPSKS